MTMNLTGVNKININNLTGKTDLICNPLSYKIKLLKNSIINNYLIPLFAKQWTLLNENIFFIDKFQEKLNAFYKTYKLDELLVYIELLKILKMLIENHNLLVSNEGQISGNKDPNEIITMIYKTTMIRLVPEYEIYNSIIGRPNAKRSEKYNELIISDIKKMMTNENVSFTKIKEFIEKKYTLNIFKQ